MGGSSQRLIRTVCPKPIGVGVTLMNASVAIVMLAVLPVGMLVCHGV